MRRLIGCVTAACLAAAVPGTASAATQDYDLRGKVTIDGKAVVLAPAVSLVKARPALEVRIAFYGTPLPAQAEAAARAAGAWPKPESGPAVLIDFVFKDEVRMATADALASCSVTFHNFSRPLVLKGAASDCHAASIGGAVLPNGTFTFNGIVYGEGKGYSLMLPSLVEANLRELYGLPSTTTTTSAAPAAPAIPPNTVSGTMTHDGQTLKPTHGVALYKAETDDDSVNVAFFDKAPGPTALDDLRKGSWGEGRPIVTMTIYFKRGAPMALDAVTYCAITGWFDKGGPMTFNFNDAASCGISVVSGAAKAGGSVAVRAKGQGDFRERKPYTWDLTFNLPVAK